MILNWNLIIDLIETIESPLCVFLGGDFVWLRFPVVNLLGITAVFLSKFSGVMRSGKNKNRKVFN